MSEAPDFDAAYRGGWRPEGVALVPWNIGEPQPAIAALIAAGRVTSPVLDAGCGVGATVLDLAERGYEVVGIDSAAIAVEEARRTLAEHGVSAEVVVDDITTFTGHDGRFATVVDSTLFHSLPVDGRPGYLASIARAARPGAVLHVLVFETSALFAPGLSPNTVSADELRAAVEPWWDVESIEPAAIHAITPPGMAEGLDTDDAGRRLMPALLLTAHRSERA